MDLLNILPYAGIAVLAVLLIIFEVQYKQDGNLINNDSYTYYTYNKTAVRITSLFGSKYKIYVNEDCPFPLKHDRFGSYFTMHARSASDVEYKIDEIFKNYQES